mmetsp:Transcript_59838/g.175561  ORF Transcript_59838/g.175561 Transcript_59838/m.175561 type:complete len:543 (-) Transcript_59838:63-1691(-)
MAMWAAEVLADGGGPHAGAAWGGRGDRVHDLALALGVVQRLLEVQLQVVLRVPEEVALGDEGHLGPQHGGHEARHEAVLAHGGDQLALEGVARQLLQRRAAHQQVCHLAGVLRRVERGGRLGRSDLHGRRVDHGDEEVALVLPRQRRLLLRLHAAAVEAEAQPPLRPLRAAGGQQRLPASLRARVSGRRLQLVLHRLLAAELVDALGAQVRALVPRALVLLDDLGKGAGVEALEDAERRTDHGGRAPLVRAQDGQLAYGDAAGQLDNLFAALEDRHPAGEDDVHLGAQVVLLDEGLPRVPQPGLRIPVQRLDDGLVQAPEALQGREGRDVVDQHGDLVRVLERRQGPGHSLLLHRLVVPLLREHEHRGHVLGDGRDTPLPPAAEDAGVADDAARRDEARLDAASAVDGALELPDVHQGQPVAPVVGVADLLPHLELGREEAVQDGGSEGLGGVLEHQGLAYQAQDLSSGLLSGKGHPPCSELVRRADRRAVVEARERGRHPHLLRVGVLVAVGLRHRHGGRPRRRAPGAPINALCENTLNPL